MATTPLLSIGMIFQNEERCLESCLKSLEPLRQAIPCELIMADTGAEDGSREIAEKYADEVFDFEWIDDFAAARNAVMDKCSGKWYLTIDCDEWLDEDISELTSFLKSRQKAEYAYVVQRNYFSAELEKGELFSDFHAMRLVRMSTGKRYCGAIHEAWHCQGPTKRLLHTILHHDGYFFADPKEKKKKVNRNMQLLRQELANNPESLRTLVECIECEDVDQVQYVRRAVEIVQKRRDTWTLYGGDVMRYAVKLAWIREMAETEDWIEYGRKTFPGSVFVQIDLNFAAFMFAYREKEWEKAMRYGEDYLSGLHTLRYNKLSGDAAEELVRGGFSFATPPSQRELMVGLSDAYRKNGQGEKALEIISSLEGEKLTSEQVRNIVVLLCQLHAETALNTAPALMGFYEKIAQEKPDKQKCSVRISSFTAMAALCFGRSYREEEKGHDGYWRPAYTAFLALADQCEAGRAAVIMNADSPEEIRAVLSKVEYWQALPIEALEHALQAGVPFPLKENPVNMEAMDGLAARLTHDENTARQIALSLPDKLEQTDRQSLYWAQSLVMAALRTFDWKLGKKEVPVSAFACPEKKKDAEKKLEHKCTPEEGLALIRRFAQVESAMLPLTYTAQALAEESASLLPPMHRWGLYCIRALEALDSGNPHEYLSILRRGLKACPGEKDMVQFLLDRFQEDARPKANPELLALAERVRAILAAYGPDNPAARAIRESEAYKQVAWIIEPMGQMVQ